MFREQVGCGIFGRRGSPRAAAKDKHWQKPVRANLRSGHTKDLLLNISGSLLTPGLNKTTISCEYMTSPIKLRETEWKFQRLGTRDRKTSSRWMKWCETGEDGFPFLMFWTMCAWPICSILPLPPKKYFRNIWNIQFFSTGQDFGITPLSHLFVHLYLCLYLYLHLYLCILW